MRTSARTTRKKAAYPRLRFQKKSYILGAVVVGAIIGTTLLTLISPLLALTISGILSMIGAGYYETGQRRFWEQSQDFKIHNLREKHDGLVREVARNQGDIAALKTSILKTTQKIDQQERSFKSHKRGALPEDMEDAIADLRETAQRPRSSAYSEDIIDLELTPRTVKSPANSSKADDDIPTFAPAKTRKAPTISNTNEKRIEDMPVFSDMVVRELIHHAIRNQSVDVFLQPIVRLPQRKARFYEMFARIRAKPGLYLPAGQYLHVAAQESLVHDIDSLLLMECLQTIEKTAHIEKAAPFFLNITTATLTNAAFMKRLLTFLAKNKHLSQRIVFEIRQSDFEAMSPGVLEILRGLGKLGCSLSLDHVERINFDLKFLQILKVRFVKIEALSFMQKARSDSGYRDLLNMKRKLEGNGIGVIVEKVESEFVLKEILDFDVHYGQGHLFGKPDLQGAYQSKKTA